MIGLAPETAPGHVLTLKKGVTLALGSDALVVKGTSAAQMLSPFFACALD